MNTVVAFPFGNSTNLKDHVFSEEVFTEIVKALSPGVKSFIVANSKTDITKVIIDGYYFELSSQMTEDISTGTVTMLYIYTKENSAGFYELQQDGDGECLFTVRQSALASTCRETQVTISQLKTFNDLINRPSFYVAPVYDSNKTDQIWVKSDTMNPYVYYNSQWIPLGAVYKS